MVEPSQPIHVKKKNNIWILGSPRKVGSGVGVAHPKPYLPLACNTFLLKPVCSGCPKGHPGTLLLGALCNRLPRAVFQLPSSA